MKRKQHFAALLLAMFFTDYCLAQLQVDGSGNYRLNPTAPGPRNFTIGDAYATGATSVLNVRGDLLGTGNTSGNVFMTNAPSDVPSYWRMFHGNVDYTLPSDERGQIFSLPDLGDFFVHAPSGHLHLLTTFQTRLRLNADWTSPMGPGDPFPGVERDGFMLLARSISAFNNGGSRAPFTRLHLIDDVNSSDNPLIYAQEQGYRPWQRNGITFTGNADQSYIGHRYDTSDNTDFVIQWSDNPNGSPWGVDRLKFVFTTQYNAGSSKGAATMEGMEAMRFWPASNTEVNVGIGDFAPSAVGDPTERLDILDGHVRIRELPTTADAADPLNLTKYMVVDDDGVVHWRTLPPAAIANCEWTRLNAGIPGPKYVVSGYGTPSSTSTCPDRSWMYGIGVGAPTYKLQVVHNEAEATSSGGIHVSYKGADVGETRGVSALVEPAQNALSLGYGALYHVRGLGTTSSPFGSGMGSLSRVTLDLAGYTCGEVTGAMGDVYAKEGTASTVHGVRGYVISQLNGTVTTAYGVRASASASGDGTIATSYGVHGYGANGSTASYGVYGQAITGGSNGAFSIYGTSPGNGATDWSGYFAGRVQIQGDLWHGTTQIWSDAGLKTEVEELDNADERLAALTPRTYRYTSVAQERMVLPGGEQLGFVAQEVEQVLPELVSSTVIPAQLDSLGNEVYPELQIKGVNYVGLIPLLVAGYQEQRTTIADLQEQMAGLQQALASCCTQGMGGGDQRMQLHEGDAKSLLGDERALLIQPNPFSTATTVRYTLEKSGRMQLLANSSDGKELRVLQEGAMEPGQYSYEWHTASLAPGVYYVTLLLDGEPLVKKAVKLER